MPGFAPAQITAEDLALARAYLDACGIAAESATSLLDGLPARLGRRYPDNWLRHHLRTALLAELRHLGRRYGQPAEPLEPDCVLDIDAAGLRALRVLPPALRDAWFASSGFALAPDAAARAATRAAWGITDTDRLAGFVGRLNHQKNPLFLMEVFAAMAAQDPHWKLLLVGTGEMEPEMRAAAARRGLTDRVIFAGVQSDVPAFMNAFDLFLLPSNFEGSPVTLVEAQGCGVPCLASTNVPDDGSVTDLVHFLPLAAPLTDWAAKAEAIAAHGDHDDHWAALSAAGYELKTAARRMEQLYDKLGGHA